MSRGGSEAGHWKALFEASADAGLLVDVATGQIQDANAALIRLLGYSREEVVGTHFTDVLGTQTETSAPPFLLKRKDGSTFWAETRMQRSDSQPAFLVSIRDVSRRVERQEELRAALLALEDAHNRLEKAQARVLHAGKLAAVGQLALGVAHQINNPAAFVLANLGASSRHLASLARKLPGDADVTELIAIVDENTQGMQRICRTVDELRVFSQLDRTHHTQVELDAVVAGAFALLQNDLRHRAALVHQRLPGCRVHAQAGRLVQVVMTMLQVVAEGIEAGSASRHRIEVAVVCKNDVAQVQVSSTGGTHLPLPGSERALAVDLARDIVSEHSGELLFTYRNDSTQVRLELPAAGTVFVPPPTPERRRLLLIDDEPFLLKAMRRLLATEHEVETALGGAEGLARLDTDRAFDLVICDLMMPKVDGIAVYETVCERSPELAERFVLATGGAFTARAQAFLERSKVPTLTKPLAPAAIRALIATAS